MGFEDSPMDDAYMSDLMVAEIKALKEKIAALKKAGDAMAEYFREEYRDDPGSGNHYVSFYQAWDKAKGEG